MRNFYLYLILISWIFLAISCKKDNPVNRENPLQPVLDNPPVTTPPPPNIFAGQDIVITMPTDSCRLSGSVTVQRQTGLRYLWRQVSGPAPGYIPDSTNLRTMVTNLIVGTYEFELSVTNNSGLTNKDTVAVKVRPAPSISQGNGVITFHNLPWQCPMGCTITIQCFNCYVPANQQFNIYLRSTETLNQWVEVLPINQWTNNVRYVYSIDNNSLVVYTDDATGLAEVMITY